MMHRWIVFVFRCWKCRLFGIILVPQKKQGPHYFFLLPSQIESQAFKPPKITDPPPSAMSCDGIFWINTSFPPCWTPKIGFYHFLFWFYFFFIQLKKDHISRGESHVSLFGSDDFTINSVRTNRQRASERGGPNVSHYEAPFSSIQPVWSPGISCQMEESQAANGTCVHAPFVASLFSLWPSRVEGTYPHTSPNLRQPFEIQPTAKRGHTAKQWLKEIQSLPTLKPPFNQKINWSLGGK